MYRVSQRKVTNRMLLEPLCMCSISSSSYWQSQPEIDFGRFLLKYYKKSSASKSCPWENLALQYSILVRICGLQGPFFGTPCVVILIVVGWCQSLCQSYQKLTESHQSGTGAQPELIDLCNVTISI